MFTLFILSLILGAGGFKAAEVATEKAFTHYLVRKQRKEFRAYWEGYSTTRPARQKVSA